MCIPNREIQFEIVNTDRPNNSLVCFTHAVLLINTTPMNIKAEVLAHEDDFVSCYICNPERFKI